MPPPRRPRALLVLSAILAVVLALVLVLWLEAPQRLAVATGAARPGRPPPPLVGPPACEAPCADLTLTVLTLNVLCSFCRKEGYDGWSARAPRLRALLAEVGADVVGLQEVSGQAALRDLLPDSPPYTVVAAPWWGGIYGDGLLLVRSDRLRVEDAGEVWLGRSPRLPLSWGWQPLDFPRLAAWARLRDAESGQALLVVSTHLDSQDPNREAGARLLGERFAPLARRQPVILLGDLNIPRAEPFLDLARSGSLADAEALAQHAVQQGALEGVAHTRRELKPDRRIDHVLVGGPGSVEVLEWVHRAPVYGEPARRPSDHPAVAATLRFRP